MMKLRPALIASVIGIYLLSIVASVYVGARAVGRLPSLFSQLGSPYSRHRTAGDQYSRRGNYAAAIREYDQMVRLRPNKVEGYLSRSIAENHAGLYDRAIQDDTRGLQLLSERKGSEEEGAPGSTPYEDLPESVSFSQARLYNERASAYAAKGDMANALSDDKQFIVLEPNAFMGYAALSAHYERNRQYALDVANWKEAVRRMPDNASCWGSYAWAQYQFGHIPEAIVSGQRAIQLAPDDEDSRYKLALCYAVMERWELAEPVYRKAMELDLDGREGLLKALQDEGETRQEALQAVEETQKQALQDVRDALRDHPGSPALRKAEALLTGE